MATTQNITLGKDYQLIATNAEDFFLSLPWIIGATVVVATTDSDSVAPVSDLRGHELTGTAIESINRNVIGPGYVYAKSKTGVPLTVVVNVW